MTTCCQIVLIKTIKFSFMEEWIKCNIGNVCNTISDTYRGDSDEVVLVNTSDVLDGKCMNHQKSPNKDLKGQFKKTFQRDDILYSEIRPANKRFAYIDFDGTDYIASTKLMVIRHKENIIPQFLYYIITSQAVIEELQMLAESRSGTFPQITFTELANQPIELPPLSEQAKIVRFLKSLDDKIEVNRRINDNLEQQAQALFKSWFVDFEPFRDQPFVESELGMIPKGWRVGTLFDVAEIFDKQRKPLSGKEREGMKRLYPYYGATSCMDYVDNYLFDGIYTLIGEDGSVAKEDGSPYMQYVWGKFWVNNHAHILQGKNGFSTEMIYVLLSTTNIQHLVTGAVQAKLSQANMQKIVLAIPPTNVLNQVRPVIDSMYETRRERENESRRLAELRDTLLPRLMSGELSVDGLKGQFAVSPGRCPGSNEHVSNKTAL